MRVSDDDYWKDFPGEVKSLTPRLLQTDLLVTRPFGDWSTYARVLRWQVLQTDDPTTRIDSPYERAPQVGARYAGPWRGGFDVGFEAEFNRFANPDDRYLADRQTGVRTHALGSIARPFFSPGWSVTPKVSFNAATLFARPAARRRPAQRVARHPDRSASTAPGRSSATPASSAAPFRQTLEPRLFYVNTPYRRQADLPNFDAVAEGLQLRFDLHREPVLRRRPRLRFEPADGRRDLAHARSRHRRRGVAGRPRAALSLPRPAHHARRRAADAALLRRPRLRLDDAWCRAGSSTPRLQFNPDSHRIERSLAGMRYSPGPVSAPSA